MARRIVLFLNVLFAFFFLAAGTSVAFGDSLVVAQWNLQNLYDPDDDPKTKGDDSYTSSGWTRWTFGRYRMKLTNVADVVSSMKPDIICLEEIENRRVLTDLQEVLANVFNWEMKEIVHRDSTDPRAIDNAILSRYKPTNVKWIKAPGSRPSVFAHFEIMGAPIVIVANHWKSRSGNAKISEAKREVIADRVRDEYRKRLAKDASLAIIVTGDFNDSFDDRVPLECGPFSTNMVSVLEKGDSLFCLSALLPEDKRGTFFYSQSRSWFSFDTMNVSRGLLPMGEPSSPWVVDFGSYQVYVEDRMRYGDFGAPYAFRRVGTKHGHRFEYGYSDHFPLLVKVKLRKSKAKSN